MISTIVISISILGAGGGDLDPAGVEFFEKNIRPLLVENCYKCHSSQSKKVKGGLLLDTQDGWMSGGDSGPAIVPGHPEESLLIKAVRYEDEDLEMPPKEKLSDEAIRRLVKWVEMGAPDPRSDGTPKIAPTKIDIEAGKKFWAFQPPADVPAPSVKDADWPRDDIDRFILNRLETAKLRPVKDADQRTLIRRLSFDLTGLPPTPREVERFLGDKSPEAVERLVDRLLDSDRFGERWGRHWLDIARYSESTGKTRNYPYSHAWRYRDYVINAFNKDKPYDRFVIEQIAGDLLKAGSDAQRNEQRTATAFLALGPKDLNERNNLQYTMDNVDEQMDTLGRAVLALTIGCARCHDHKFDPIPTTDYYALAGIFNSTEILAGLGNRSRGKGQGYNAELLYDIAGAKAPASVTANEPQKDARGAREAKRLQIQLASLKKEQRQLQQADRKDRGSRKKRKKATRSFSETETTSAAQRQKRLREVRGEIQKLTQRLKRLSKNRQRNSPAPTVPRIMGVRDRDAPRDCRVYIRGEVTKPAAAVPRGFLQVLGNLEGVQLPSDSSGRLEFARWLTSPKNPLTARVMVNRMWYHLFGRGLVRTVDNFGNMGEKPSHPELLDHLARRFVAGGWSLKKMIKTLVLTRVYQLGIRNDESNSAVDPDNVLVWRQNQRRLDAEAFRDAILLASGQLDRTPPRGSSVTKLAVGEIGRNLSAVSAMTSENVRRSVYLPILRSFVPEMLEAFDFAEPSMVKGRRDVTTVATQALYLMNSKFVRDQARYSAERILGTKNLDDAGRVRLAYRVAFARLPNAAERKRAVAFLDSFSNEESGEKKGKAAGESAWAALCQALFASAEFRYVN